jgi:hypothetical protein
VPVVAVGWRPGVTRSSERRIVILGRLVQGGTVDASSLSGVCADAVAVAGAAIVLITPDGSRALPGASDDRSRRVVQLQDTLGEGPSIDAHRLGRPVIEDELLRREPPRWPAFCPRAVDAGVLGIAAFPLHIGAVKLGALDLHLDHTGGLDDEQHANAHAAAEVASSALVAMQASAAPGEVASELLAGIDLQYVVHQASGMVAAQLEVPVAEALVVLQARAFTEERTTAEVAHDVVARRVRFDRDGGS